MGRPTSSQAEAKELRAKLESAYSVLGRTQEQLKAAESDRDHWKEVAETRERAMAKLADELERVTKERDVWQGAHAISQNTMASMAAERDRLRAALEIAATDTSWEYVHKVAGEALAGKYSEASDRGEVKESAEKDSEKYSVPALPIGHEAKAKLERHINERGELLLLRVGEARDFATELRLVKEFWAKARTDALEEAAMVADALLVPGMGFVSAAIRSRKP